MSHVIESAKSGRSHCRACGQTIARGDLRFGEREPNPFGEGEATWWFHLRCGACKRPEEFLAALETSQHPVEDGAELERVARRGLERPKLVRIAGAAHDPSGRARCRSCRELIRKGDWRVELNVWENGRFGAIGFVHVRCAAAYFGTQDVLDHLVSCSPALHPDDVLEIERALAARTP